MISVSRDKGYQEFRDIIRRIGVPCDDYPLSVMPFGDACFSGNGPDGPISVGIERKKLADLLQCIDDSRLSAHQMVGMRDTFQKCYLMIEGVFKPHENGTLMAGYENGKLSWAPFSYRSQRVMYSKLRRYLFSVSHAGFDVIFTRDIFQSCYDVVEAYHYWQKDYKKHTSMLELQKFAIPTLKGKPPLVRRWAFDIESVGIKHSEEAEKYFRTPIALATADEAQWIQAGMGVATAQKIVREIQGWS